MVSQTIIDDFFGNYPHLKDRGIEVKSLPTLEYNCIAWSLAVSDKWLWPKTPDAPSKLVSRNTSNNGTSWSSPKKQDPTLEVFYDFYARKGFFPSKNGEDGRLEKGKTKIVLYVYPSKNGETWVDHASRQLPNGQWASKLGEDVDIIHPFPRDMLDVYRHCTELRFLERAAGRRVVKR